MRLTVKLRVQNPNAKAVDFRGVALQMDLDGRTVASGVSDVRAKIPRYGETVVGVPLTVSGLQVVGQALAIMTTARSGAIPYELRGKVGDDRSNPTRFAIEGEVGILGLDRQSDSR